MKKAAKSKLVAAQIAVAENKVKLHLNAPQVALNAYFCTNG
jgi:hypothetical protein